MSLRDAIELIRNELPAEVLRNSETKLLEHEQANDLSVSDFSFGFLSNPEGFKSILEKKLRIIEGQKINHALRKFNQERLDFVNESTTSAEAVEFWSGYGMVKVRYFLILKKRKTLWFLIDLGRKKFLKHFDPRPPFGQEVFWK